MSLSRDDDPRRLLSPMAPTARALRLALQAALPVPPTSRDADEVAYDLLAALSAHSGVRVSQVNELSRSS